MGTEVRTGAVLGESKDEQFQGVAIAEESVDFNEVLAKHGPFFTTYFNKFIWHGGSVYDAWINAVSGQVGQVILTMPTSYAQLGFGFGVFFHLFFSTVGIWTCYLIATMYVEYRSRREKEGVDFKRHVIQYHEVLGYLVGPWARRASLFFNIGCMGSIAVVQIVACASDVYYLNPHLSKRDWALIFGAGGLLTIFIPTIHNFRVWALVGIITTTFTAWYMTIAAATGGQVVGVKHSGPEKLQLFFTGTSNIMFAFGGHAITVEIMHAMWKPRKYRWVYPLAVIYVLTITMPHSVTMYWAFGDLLIKRTNAFAVLPSSNFRSAAIVMMILHQGVAFAMYVIPLYFLWEKALGLHHTSSFLLRCLARTPVALLVWLIALAFPFFGPLNSLIGALILSFATYVIPCVTYLITFWSPLARQNVAMRHPKWLPPWKLQVVINCAIVAVILVVGVGFGAWASIHNIVDEVKSFGLFDKCFQC